MNIFIFTEQVTGRDAIDFEDDRIKVHTAIPLVFSRFFPLQKSDFSCCFLGLMFAAIPSCGT